MQGVSVVLCDFACHPSKKIDFAGLRKELSRPNRDVVLVECPCREGAAKLEPLTNRRVLMAGCPLLKDRWFAEGFSAGPTDLLVLDVKGSIFDLHDDAISIRAALRDEIEAYIRILEGKETEELENVRPPQKVLVYGGGLSGLCAASALGESGIPTDVLDVSEPAVSPGCLAEAVLAASDSVKIRNLRTAAENNVNVVFIPHDDGCRISSIDEGYQIKTNDGTEVAYGAVVFAPERIEPKPAEEGALNLTDLYSLLNRNVKLGGTTVFLLDRRRSSSGEIFRDVLAAAKTIRDRFRGDVWILLKNAQVSRQYQEELYGRCRDAGVLFVKYRDDLAVANDFGSFDIFGFDTQTHAPFSIRRPERLVIPQIPLLSEAARGFAAGLQLRLGGEEYSQVDSLWAIPNETNRTGVFAAGSARGNMTVDEIERDVFSLVAAVRDRLDPDGFVVEEYIPVVDANECVYCLTCVRVCPFGAMAKDPEERVARVIASACRGCGICVGECPAQALEVRNLGRQSLFSGIQILAGGD